MRAAYFDIDGTLLIWPEPTLGVHQIGTTPILNEPLVEKMKEHFLAGDQVVIWSANPASIEYFKKHHPNIAGHVSAILKKPDILYDDNCAWIDKREWVGLK